jgi:hypothetical protein
LIEDEQDASQDIVLIFASHAFLASHSRFDGVIFPVSQNLNLLGRGVTSVIAHLLWRTEYGSGINRSGKIYGVFSLSPGHKKLLSRELYPVKAHEIPEISSNFR